MIKSSFENFMNIYRDAADKGVLLLIACILAMMMVNWGYADAYYTLRGFHVADANLMHFTNDFLMAIFFLLVGLEVKRELLVGKLSTNKQRLIPVMAAIMGVVAPVAIFVSFNWGDSDAMRGWAVPAATDIAFALGMLSLFGKSLPPQYRIFLAALAIIDDIIAICIIALFYTANIQPQYFVGIAFLSLIIYFAGRKNALNPVSYVFLGLFLWYCFLKSGVHTSICGVVLAFVTPFSKGSFFYKVEKSIAKPVQYAILPLFAFLNSGVKVHFSDFVQMDSLVMGIALGLFIGKQLGIMFVIFVSKALNMLGDEAKSRACVPSYYGVAMLCGIGFTMSLFVADLAYGSNELLLDKAKIGVLLGSLLSAVFAGLWLKTYKALTK